MLGEPVGEQRISNQCLWSDSDTDKPVSLHSLTAHYDHGQVALEPIWPCRGPRSPGPKINIVLRAPVRRDVASKELSATGNFR